MPTVTISEKHRRYLEKLRKKAPLERVPSIKKTVELALEFIEESEVDFLNWIRKQENRAETNANGHKKLKREGR